MKSELFNPNPNPNHNPNLNPLTLTLPLTLGFLYGIEAEMRRDMEELESLT